MSEGTIRLSKSRRSSIELLRIIAMLMIILHHFALHSTTYFGANFTINAYLMQFFQSFGKVGVAIFFIITGYFMFGSKRPNSRKDTTKRLLRLARPVWFYAWTIFIIFATLGMIALHSGFPIDSNITRSILPIISDTYWFVGSYILLYLLSPFLKRWFDALTKRKIIGLLVTAILLFNLPAYINFFLNGHFSTFTGVDSLYIILIYPLLGYFFHRFNPRHKDIQLAILTLCATLFAFIAGPLFREFFINQFGVSVPGDLFWNASSVLCIGFAASAFVLVSRLNFTSRFVNYLGGLMFSIYLIHDNFLVRNWIWDKFLHVGTRAVNYSPAEFILFAVITVLLIFVVCSIIEALRRFFVSRIMVLSHFISQKFISCKLNTAETKQ